MKRFLNFIGYIIFNAVFFYLPFVLIELDFNPVKWGTLCRAISVLLFTGWQFFVLATFAAKQKKAEATVKKSGFFEEIERRRKEYNK